MKTIKRVAFATIILVLASMFTSCETIVAQGIYNGVEAWRSEYFGD